MRSLLKSSFNTFLKSNKLKYKLQKSYLNIKFNILIVLINSVKDKGCINNILLLDFEWISLYTTVIENLELIL